MSGRKSDKILYTLFTEREEHIKSRPKMRYPIFFIHSGDDYNLRELWERMREVFIPSFHPTNFLQPIKLLLCIEEKRKKAEQDRMVSVIV